MVSHTTDQNFEHDVLRARAPVFVDFSERGAFSSRISGPIIDRLSSVARGRAKVMKMDPEANPDTVQKFGVREMPTVLLFINGELVRKLPGIRPTGVYLNILDRLN
jgi:thioredoxin 1